MMRLGMTILALMLTCAATYAEEITNENDLGKKVSCKYVTSSAEYSDYNVPENLFDDNVNTKWCIFFEPGAYVVFKTNSPVKISGYSLTTAEDTKDISGRNPRDWNLYGSYDRGQTWELIDQVRNDEVMQPENFASSYFLANAEKSYDYFKYEVEANKNDICMQLSELSLFVKASDTQTTSILDTQTNLFTSVDQFSSPFTEEFEGSVEALIDGNPDTYWHSRWHEGDQPSGTHYIQIEVAELPEEFGFTFTRRPTSNDHVTRWSVYGVPTDNADAAKDECTLLAEVETPYENYLETLSSPAIQSQGFTIIRFYAEETNNYNRGYWHVSEFAINPVIQVSEIELAIREALEVYLQYADYSCTFEAGTNPGNYGVDEVAAFEAALEAAQILDTPEALDLTIEQIQQLADDIQNTYNAILDSRLPFASDVAEGYYYITSAMDFRKDIWTDGYEDPETGQWIDGENYTEHYTKAMYTNGDYGLWGDINRLDPNYLWKVVKADDKQYYIVNCQTENQFTWVNMSLDVSLSTQESVPMVFDYAGAEGIYNIRLAEQPERDYYYIHCGGHNEGYGNQGNLVGWRNTYADYHDDGASEWKLEPVDEETALAIIESGLLRKEFDRMNEEATSLIAEGVEMNHIVNETIYSKNYDPSHPLITSVDQFSSPYNEPSEGSIEALLDGDQGTFWHSTWSQGTVDNGVHYLQVSDIDAASVVFSMSRRNTYNDHITLASVYGYDQDDENLSKEDGELLATIVLPFASSDETIISEVFPTNGHHVLRIYEEATTSNRGYWHMSEFQLYPAVAVQLNDPYGLGEMAEAMSSASEAWTGINVDELTSIDEPTEKLEVLRDAYTALHNALNNGEYLIKLSIDDSHYATFCAPFDAELESHVNAYTVDGMDEEGVLTLTQLYDVIPAGVPVIVSCETPYEHYYSQVPTESNTTYGLLCGTHRATYVPAGSYILRDGIAGINFYQIIEGSTYHLDAHRAYLCADSDASVLTFHHDIATGIQALDALTRGQAQIYDLSGRQIKQLQKGVNIVNGVKIMVK